MNFLLNAILIFLEIIEYFIFADIILSWLTLFGIRFRPQILRNIIDPMYHFVRKYIPTTIGPFDFTPLIIIFWIIFLQGLIYKMF